MGEATPGYVRSHLDWPHGDKRVVVAAPRGYCAGVDRAVITVEKALDPYGAPVYVRKQIVHNRHVVETLEATGAIFVEEPDEVPEGAHRRVLGARGVAGGPRRGGRRGLRTIDATCPLVTKVHHGGAAVRRRGPRDPADRPRGPRGGRGTAGEAPEQITLVDAPERRRPTSRSATRARWPGCRRRRCRSTRPWTPSAALREQFPLLLDPPSDDICYATQNRQLAVKQIAAEADLVIVVGSPNSSNSVRLVEVALEAGAGAARLVDNADEIEDAWLEGATTVGVTSGASVPEELVRGVLAGWPSAGSTTSSRSSRPRSPWSSRCRRSYAGAAGCRRTLSAPEASRPRRPPGHRHRSGWLGRRVIERDVDGCGRSAGLSVRSALTRSSAATSKRPPAEHVGPFSPPR